MELRSIHDWQKMNEESGLHSGDAMKQYQTGVDNDITLEAEDENGVYEAIMEKLVERLAKHKAAYNSHIKGSMKTDVFIKDIEITKRMMEDFQAYQDRFVKLVTTAAKKAANR